MHVRRHSGDTTRQNLSALGDEFFQQVGVLVIDCLGGDVDSAARHRAVGATESGTAFGGLWLHVIWFRDGGCAVSGMGCTFSSPADSECADSSCYAWSYN